MGPFRIVFMGTPAFAAVALKALADAGHDVVAVYSQPPRPKGRGMETQKSPVYLFAEEQGIAIRTPVSLKSTDEVEAFQSLRADVAVVAAYGLILPKAVLDAPRYGCLNIHASLLPRWRGAAPIQRAIMAGDKETGVTVMQMEEGLDTGPMLLKEALPISTDMNAGALHDALAEIGARLIGTALDRLASLKPDLVGREIEWRLGPLPTAQCDPGLVKQVFINLLSNAIKYGAGRPIEVIVEPGADLIRRAGGFVAEHPTVAAVRQAARVRLREVTGLTIEVTIVAPGTVPRSDGKAVRVLAEILLVERECGLVLELVEHVVA